MDTHTTHLNQISLQIATSISNRGLYPQRWYRPSSAGNSAPSSLEIQSRNVDCCRLNSPVLSLGSTQFRMFFWPSDYDRSSDSIGFGRVDPCSEGLACDLTAMMLDDVEKGCRARVLKCLVN